MINLTNKDIKNIIICIVILIVVFVTINIYNTNFYLIDILTLPEKSLLQYKNLETDNSYEAIDFMHLVSNGYYQEAFDLLDSNNKMKMFDNDIEKFKNDLKVFSNVYNDLEYNTIFSHETENYIDEEIMCMICDSNAESLHSIRFNIRVYKTGKAPRIIIININ